MPTFILILTMPHISINKTYPKTNLKGKKKILQAHLLLHHPPSRYHSAYSASIWILPWFWIWHHFFLISSDTALTFGSQKTQDKLSTDTGTISKFSHKYIIYISDNHPSACRPCAIWIIWPAKHCNPEFFITTLRSVGSNLEEIRLK